MGKIRVGLIFGGKSGEHEVSLNSANSILKALDPAKYEVVPIGISKTGTWLLGAEPADVLAQGGFNPKLIPATLCADPNEARLLPLQGGGEFSSVDVIFPVLHGTYGEDGTVQGLLELANIPYVGSGVLGSALGMDKISMKRVFAQSGLAQPRFAGFNRSEWEKSPEKVLQEIEELFGYPCFVKPSNLGSSVGISKAHGRSELARALGLAAQYDRRLIVEEFIDCREIEVSVLGNEEPIASIPGEIVPCNEFYDYKAKYIDGNSALMIPAELPEGSIAEIRAMAIQAFQVLDCAGLARVDFFIDRQTGKVLINEVNTLPGFTNISMYPKLWEASGISYAELIDRLIELALERHREKNRSTTVFELP